MAPLYSASIESLYPVSVALRQWARHLGAYAYFDLLLQTGRKACVASSGKRYTQLMGAVAQDDRLYDDNSPAFDHILLPHLNFSLRDANKYRQP